LVAVPAAKSRTNRSNASAGDRSASANDRARSATASRRRSSTVTTTGRSFEARCIFVVRVRDGLIVESRDYVDHVALARAGDRLAGVLGA
jgi:ketosteroid isomerase-like protein